MQFTKKDFRIIVVSIVFGVLAWFLLQKIGIWLEASIEAIEYYSTRTGSAIAVLVMIWQFIREGELIDERRNKKP